MSEPIVGKLIREIRTRIDDRYLFGQSAMLESILIAWLCRGHVLVEGPPGTAKTSTAKLLAGLLARSFRRVQFTSDLLPGDILGSHVYLPDKAQFAFIKGPIFTDFLLADEINRAPPRTQSALLEAMEEKQVTLDGKLFSLGEEFFVIATQNPRDHEGTFPLPEVQLDRFLFKLVVRHSDAATESRVLREILEGRLPIRGTEAPVEKVERARMDTEIASVRVDDSLLGYITAIVDATRSHPMLTSGCSIRAAIALGRSARVRALIHGRAFATADDVKSLAPAALRHRLRLSPEAQVSSLGEDQVIQEILSSVPFPG